MARIVEKRRAIYMYGLFSIINEDVPEYEIVAVSNCVDYLKRYADELNNFIGYKLFTVLEVQEIIDDNLYFAVAKLDGSKSKYDANIVIPSRKQKLYWNRRYNMGRNKKIISPAEMQEELERLYQEMEKARKASELILNVEKELAELGYELVCNKIKKSNNVTK